MSIWAVRPPLQQGRTAARPGQGRSGPQPREPGRVENGFGASGCPQAPQPLAQPAQRGRHPDVGERTPAGHCAAAWEGAGAEPRTRTRPAHSEAGAKPYTGLRPGPHGRGSWGPGGRQVRGCECACVRACACISARTFWVCECARVCARVCVCVCRVAPSCPCSAGPSPTRFPGGAAAGGRRSLSAAQARGQAYCQKHILHCDIL